MAKCAPAMTAREAIEAFYHFTCSECVTAPDSSAGLDRRRLLFGMLRFAQPERLCLGNAKSCGERSSRVDREDCPRPVSNS